MFDDRFKVPIALLQSMVLVLMQGFAVILRRYWTAGIILFTTGLPLVTICFTILFKACALFPCAVYKVNMFFSPKFQGLPRLCTVCIFKIPGSETIDN